MVVDCALPSVSHGIRPGQRWRAAEDGSITRIPDRLKLRRPQGICTRGGSRSLRFSLAIWVGPALFWLSTAQLASASTLRFGRIMLRDNELELQLKLRRQLWRISGSETAAK